MELIVIFKIILLGIVEGLTEFLPVSSTGHLIFIGNLINFDTIPNKIFEIVIQFGAILAVCVIYKDKLIYLLKTLFVNQKSFNLVLNISIAFLPAAIIGVFMHDFIKTILFSNIVVACSLIFGGVVMIIIDKCNTKIKYKEIEQLNKKTALSIGLLQILAMIPGVSRSGATIIGGVAFGLSRKSAAEFSFLLAIPTIFGATIYDIYVNREIIDFSFYLPIFLGFIIAFFSALLVVVKFVDIIRRYGFAPFGYYRILMGILILYLI